MAFSLFHKKKAGQPVHMEYHGTPVIRCSICTGEQVAGFRNPDGHVEEVTYRGGRCPCRYLDGRQVKAFFGGVKVEADYRRLWCHALSTTLSIAQFTMLHRKVEL